MPDGRIGREEWATELVRLIGRFDNGNKSAFSRRVGFTTRTIDRWLKREVDITYESLNRVMRQLQLPQHEGYDVLERLGLIPMPMSPPDAELITFDPAEDEPPVEAFPVPEIPEPPADVRLDEPIPADPRDDPVIQTIMVDEELTEEQRRTLVDLQLDRMEEDYLRRREAYELRVKEDMNRRRAEYENIRRLLGPGEQAS